MQQTNVKAIALHMKVREKRTENKDDNARQGGVKI